MKAFQVVCVLAFVASAACVPVAQKPNTSDVEVAIVPLSAQQDLFDIDDGVVDTGYPGGMFFNPFGNPFSGFMSSMDDMLRRLHDQMSQVLHRLPVDNTNPDWVDLSDGKGNTTSTSKVINGHKVTVNETVYGDDGNNSGSFFKIRIVDVRPTSEESTENSDEKTDKTKLSVLNKDVEETTPRNIVKDNSSPELTEESNNEIPQGKPENQYPLEFDDVETFGEDFTNEVFPERPIPYAEVPDYPYFEHDDINNAEPVREIESNSVDFKPIDLSNDIYVNQMMADQGAPQNPDAEVFNPYENQHNAPRSFEYLQDPSFYMVKRR